MTQNLNKKITNIKSKYEYSFVNQKLTNMTSQMVRFIKLISIFICEPKTNKHDISNGKIHKTREEEETIVFS